MDRKSWIVVVLCVISLFAWQYWYTARYQKQLDQQRQQQQQQASQPPVVPAVTDPAPPVAPPPTAEPAVAAAPGAPPATPAQPAIKQVAPGMPAEEDLIKLDTPLAEYTFTRNGGGIHRAVLHKHTTADGKQLIMNEFGLQPVGGIDLLPLPEKVTVFDVAEKTATKIVFEGDYYPGLRMRKTYEVEQDPKFSSKKKEEEKLSDYGYLLNLTITWINTTPQPLDSRPYYIQLGEEEAIYEVDPSMYTTLQWQSNRGQSQRHVDWFKASKFLWTIQTSPEKTVFSEAFKEVSWAAVNNQFFTFMVTPLEPRGIEVWATRSKQHRPQQHNKPIYAIHGALKMPAAAVPASGSVDQKFRIYTGPKEYSRLKKLPDKEDGILNFGFFAPISVFLLNTMNFLQHYLHSYALAIVGITILLKIVLWPLQTKSMRSMKRMSDNMKELQPKLEALKVKYKDNPAKQNEETMRLYKEHNISPMGGCLPSLAQFPIFLGFFYMLRTAVELRNSQFLWVEDLSRPDTVFTLIGIPINPLPLIMTASMALYMKLQPSTGNDMQKKMMMFMPLMFMAFCYNFASALALYWTTQNLLSIVQFYMTKDIREGKPTTATAGATVGGKPAIVEPPPKKRGGGKGRGVRK